MKAVWNSRDTAKVDSCSKESFLRHLSGESEEKQLWGEIKNISFSRRFTQVEVGGDERQALADNGAPVQDGAEQCKDQDEGLG